MPKVTLALPQAVDPVPDLPGAGSGPTSYHLGGDTGGLTQFAAHVEVLPPGGQSPFRAGAGDEMVYMLAGEVVLIEETESLLRVGEAACRPAGLPVGHRLENRSDLEAMYLVVASRTAHDHLRPADGPVTDADGPQHTPWRTDRPERPD